MIGSLYFHIPFCRSKCPYCHFFVTLTKKENVDLFLRALKAEWELKKPLVQNSPIHSIYFGGGTPSQLPAQAYEEIFSWVKKDCDLQKDAEITLELNPEDKHQIASYAKTAINRLSIGVQSLDNSLLTLLNRRHSATVAKEAVHLAHNHGFKNISIDIMYDLPHQSLEQVKATMDEIIHLPVTHLSVYNLVFEYPSKFYRLKEQLNKFIPSDETSLDMLEHICEQLKAIGLKRYEISAFAKPGFESYHNCTYWTGKPFLGYGPSAFSYVNGRRFQNVCNLKKYAQSALNQIDPVDFEECLEFPKNILELLAIRLRLLKGVDLSAFPCIPKDRLTVIEKLIEDNYLQRQDAFLKLTPQGINFYDTVASSII